MLTAVEIAERYGVSRAHVYNQMKRGMPSLQIGSCRRFDPEATDAWFLSQSEVAPS